MGRSAAFAVLALAVCAAQVQASTVDERFVAYVGSDSYSYDDHGTDCKGCSVDECANWCSEDVTCTGFQRFDDGKQGPICYYRSVTTSSMIQIMTPCVNDAHTCNLYIKKSWDSEAVAQAAASTPASHPSFQWQTYAGDALAYSNHEQPCIGCEEEVCKYWCGLDESCTGFVKFDDGNDGNGQNGCYFRADPPSVLEADLHKCSNEAHECKFFLKVPQAAHLAVAASATDDPYDGVQTEYFYEYYQGDSMKYADNGIKCVGCDVKQCEASCTLNADCTGFQRFDDGQQGPICYFRHEDVETLDGLKYPCTNPSHSCNLYVKRISKNTAAAKASAGESQPYSAFVVGGMAGYAVAAVVAVAAIVKSFKKRQATASPAAADAASYGAL